MATYKEKFNKQFNFPKDTSHSIADIARLTGYKQSGLQKIFNKGVAAYFTNPESVRPTVTSPVQWGYGRVFSAVMGGETVKYDKDLLTKT